MAMPHAVVLLMLAGVLLAAPSLGQLVCIRCKCSTGAVTCKQVGIPNIPRPFPYRQLVITGNIIPNASFPLVAPQLWQLSLADNQIVSLSTTLFADVKHLTHLDLSTNQLTTLPSGILRGLDKLVEVDLSFNVLKSLPPALLSNVSFSAPFKFNAANNQLMSLPEGFFHYTFFGLEVSLYKNQLQWLRPRLLAWPYLGQCSVNFWDNSFQEDVSICALHYYQKRFSPDVVTLKAPYAPQLQPCLDPAEERCYSLRRTDQHLFCVCPAGLTYSGPGRQCVASAQDCTGPADAPDCTPTPVCQLGKYTYFCRCPAGSDVNATHSPPRCERMKIVVLAETDTSVRISIPVPLEDEDLPALPSLTAVVNLTSRAGAGVVATGLTPGNWTIAGLQPGTNYTVSIANSTYLSMDFTTLDVPSSTVYPTTTPATTPSTTPTTQTTLQPATGLPTTVSDSEQALSTSPPPKTTTPTLAPSSEPARTTPTQITQKSKPKPTAKSVTTTTVRPTSGPSPEPTSSPNSTPAPGPTKPTPSPATTTLTPTTPATEASLARTTMIRTTGTMRRPTRNRPSQPPPISTAAQAEPTVRQTDAKATTSTPESPTTAGRRSTTEGLPRHATPFAGDARANVDGSTSRPVSAAGDAATPTHGTSTGGSSSQDKAENLLVIVGPSAAAAVVLMAISAFAITMYVRSRTAKTLATATLTASADGGLVACSSSGGSDIYDVSPLHRTMSQSTMTSLQSAVSAQELVEMRHGSLPEHSPKSRPPLPGNALADSIVESEAEYMTPLACHLQNLLESDARPYQELDGRMRDLMAASERPYQEVVRHQDSFASYQEMDASGQYQEVRGGRGRKGRRRRRQDAGSLKPRRSGTGADDDRPYQDLESVSSACALGLSLDTTCAPDLGSSRSPSKSPAYGHVRKGRSRSDGEWVHDSPDVYGNLTYYITSELLTDPDAFRFAATSEPETTPEPEPRTGPETTPEPEPRAGPDGEDADSKPLPAVHDQYAVPRKELSQHDRPCIASPPLASTLRLQWNL